MAFYFIVVVSLLVSNFVCRSKFTYIMIIFGIIGTPQQTSRRRIVVKVLERRNNLGTTVGTQKAWMSVKFRAA